MLLGYLMFFLQVVAFSNENNKARYTVTDRADPLLHEEYRLEGSSLFVGE